MDALRVQPDQRRELWQRIRSGASTDAATVQEMVERQASRTIPAEERLLEILLTNDDVRKIVLPRIGLEDYKDLASAAIFRALIKLDEQESEISFDTLTETIADAPQASELLPRLMMNDKTESFDESMVQSEKCLNTIRMIMLDQTLDDLASRIAEAERSGEAEMSLDLQQQHFDVRKKRDALDALLPRGHGANTA
jgi:replicative DNA helicase